MNTNLSQVHSDPRNLLCFDKPYSGVIIKTDRVVDSVYGRPTPFLNITVRLDETDNHGRPICAQRTYNFGITGHGRTMAIKDYANIVNRPLQQDELWHFRPELIKVGTKVVTQLDFQRNQYGSGPMLPIRRFCSSAYKWNS